MHRGVFLDRDGVLVADEGLPTGNESLSLLPGVPAALGALHEAGFVLVVVTNQTVIARGRLTEEAVDAVHRRLAERVRSAGGPSIARFCVCPHHPRATLSVYRVDCDCRKPKPGMILKAARELDLDPRASFLVGDRISDIAAGAAAGCRTVLVETGCHELPPIVSPVVLDPGLKPDHRCADLPAAVEWILKQA